ncbi:MAG: ABC transporter ATP-binding protein, partial [Brachybacterium tyrofermentans]
MHSADPSSSIPSGSPVPSAAGPSTADPSAPVPSGSPDPSAHAPAAPVTGAAAPVGADTALPTQSALSIRGLRKTFGKTEVVHGISLDVPRGSFYGMVG